MALLLKGMKGKLWRRKKSIEFEGEFPPPPEVSGVEVVTLSMEEQSRPEMSHDAKHTRPPRSIDLPRDDKESLETTPIVSSGISPKEPFMENDKGSDLSETAKKGEFRFPGEDSRSGKSEFMKPREEVIHETGLESKSVNVPRGEKESGSIGSSAEEKGKPGSGKPETPPGAPPEGGFAGQYYSFFYPPYAQPPYMHPYYPGFWPPFTGGKREKSRRRAGHEPVFPVWGIPWWLPPVVPPVTYPGYPGQPDPLQAPSPFFAIPEERASLESFQKLAAEESEGRRVDLKWLFGVTASLILFIALVVSSLFIITAPGNAKRISAGILRKASLVREVIDDNYLELRSKARRKPQASFLIPDLGVDIFLKGRDIQSLDSVDLAEKVIPLMAKKLYIEGYSPGIPFKTPKGAGEERGKAVCITILSALNRDSRRGMIIPLVIIVSVGIAVLMLSVAFSTRWGRVITAAFIFVSASFPVSFLSRFFTEFVLTGGGGTYKDTTESALRTLLTSSTYIFDACLGVGAFLLLVGVTGAIVSRKRMERIPPFLESRTPPELSEEFIPGTPLPEKESEMTPEIDSAEEKPGEKSPGLQA